MTQRDLRAWLRGAVKANIYSGWYSPQDGIYYAAGAHGGCDWIEPDDYEDFILDIAQFGVEPVYLDREVLWTS